LRLTFAQLNFTVGAFDANLERMREAVGAAEAAGSELVVFSELATTGYPPRDLLMHDRFVDANLETLERLARISTGRLAILTGFVDRNPSSPGKALFNAAAATLLVKVFAGQPAHGFYHWDSSLTLASPTPLFTRAEIMAGLKKLAPYRESTLLVTNLRPALIPPSGRATARRKREYQEALAFIRELAAARTLRDSQLQLLFL
jgi:hypothetical protein